MLKIVWNDFSALSPVAAAQYLVGDVAGLITGVVFDDQRIGPVIPRETFDPFATADFQEPEFVVLVKVAPGGAIDRGDS